LNPAEAFLRKFGLEVGSDPGKNRKYFAELLVVYTFAALAIYVLTTFLAPLFIRSGNDFLRGIAALNYIFNLYMCHQMPERTFFIFGEPMPLCERCMAIFIGALVAYPSAGLRVRFPKWMQSWPFVVLALVPIAVDGITQFLGMRESNTYERFSSGFIAAFAVTFFLIATILDKYETKKTFYRKGIAIPVLIPLSFLLVPLLGASLYVGAHYMSAGEAISNAAQASPNAPYYEIHYIPPHATQSIPADPFLSEYSDPILKDVGKNRAFYSHQLGAWSALALNGTPEHFGNYAYLSKGAGDYYYYDAWNKELILHTAH